MLASISPRKGALAIVLRGNLFFLTSSQDVGLPDLIRFVILEINPEIHRCTTDSLKASFVNNYINYIYVVQSSSILEPIESRSKVYPYR